MKGVNYEQLPLRIRPGPINLGKYGNNVDGESSEAIFPFSAEQPKSPIMEYVRCCGLY